MPQITRLNHRQFLIVANHCNVAVDGNWFNAEYLERYQYITGHSTGRKRAYFFTIDNISFVLRHYCRGGLISNITRNNYVYTGIKHTRPFKEIQLLERLSTYNLPTPVPIAALVTKSAIGYQASLIMSQINASENLYEILKQKTLPTNIWQGIGKTIALFHQRNIYHSDLNLRNILIDKDNKIWLIDFDKSRQTSLRRLSDNLDRLNRSFKKARTMNSSLHWNEKCWEQLMLGYNQ